MIEKNAELYGEKAQYIYKENGEMLEKTYGQFASDVMHFCTMLHETGLAGKRIAIIGDTHPAWLCAFFLAISFLSALFSLSTFFILWALVSSSSRTSHKCYCHNSCYK